MKKWQVFYLVVVGILTVGMIAAFLNRQWIIDYFRGISYKPSVEMASIKGSLKLTDRGEFLFNASRPVLDTKDEFNAKCRSEVDVEVAVLGCYTDDTIYVYNVQEDELAGIKEVTAAHELLHAVWARMSDNEKRELSLQLSKVLESNKDLLDQELSNYSVSQRQEEVFVRAGTEVANLPDALEQVYAEIFHDQDAIVGYYNSYIGVFRELEEEMDQLLADINEKGNLIDEKTTDYEARFNQLEADIVSFNSCAEVSGCFKTEAEFSVQRNRLVTDQNELNKMYDEISELIAEYNDMVEKYNADIVRGEALNRAINSNQKVEGVEQR